MKRDGKIWTTEVDRQVRTAGFHFSVSQPEVRPYGAQAGTANCIVTKSEDQVAAWLERDFPLCRLALNMAKDYLG